MKVRDAMSASVTTVRSDTPLQAAASVLASHGHCAAAVVDHEGHLVGVASRADLARGSLRPDAWTAEIDPECVVAAVMTHAPVSARPDDDLADVVGEMLAEELSAVPVVDDDQVIGIVTRPDVLRLVAERRLSSGDS
jgi:CBS domain-containing protein